jgi:drug/metabolite transporter (DMT)-like permease
MNPTDEPTSATLSLTGFLLVVLVCILWGGSIPTIKLSEHGLPPLLMATGRIALATMLLFLYTRFTQEPVMLPHHYVWHGVALGLLFGLTMVFLYQGLVFTNAARGTIFYSTKPFWVAIGAHFLVSGDRLTTRKLAGLALALVGVYLSFWSPGAAGPEMDWGNLMEIAGALCFSATALYTKWLSNREKLNHFQTLFPMMLFAIPILLISTLIFEWGYPIKIYLSDLLAFGYQSLGAQFLAYILWFWLIYRFSVSQVASFTFLVPLVGVILSSMFLGEPTTPTLWLGLAFVTVGIVLVNWPKRGHQP